MEFIVKNLAYFAVGAIAAVTSSIISLIPAAVLLYQAKSNKSKTDADAAKSLADGGKSKAEAEKIKIENIFTLLSKVDQISTQLDEALKANKDTRVLYENVQRVLRQIEITFRELLNTSHIGYWEADTEGKRIHFNETWLEFAGMTKAEALGEGWRKCIHPDDLDVVIRRDEGMILSGNTLRPIKCRIINQRTQKEITVEKTLFVVFNTDGTIYKFMGRMVEV